MNTTTETFNPMTRPDIVVADATSLAYLVWAGQLPLLHAVGGAVFLPDIVAGEAASDLSWTDAAVLARWISAGAGKSSHSVRVDRTEIGQALALARRSEPGFRAPRASEVAIVEWLVAAIQDTARPVLILAENSRVHGIVANQAVGADSNVVATRAFLALAEKQGLLASADSTWRGMLDRVTPTVLPARHVRPSQEQLDEAAHLIEAEVTARSPEQEAAITKALRDHGIE